MKLENKTEINEGEINSLFSNVMSFAKMIIDELGKQEARHSLDHARSVNSNLKDNKLDSIMSEIRTLKNDLEQARREKEFIDLNKVQDQKKKITELEGIIEDLKQ